MLAEKNQTNKATVTKLEAGKLEEFVNNISFLYLLLFF